MKTRLCLILLLLICLVLSLASPGSAFAGNKLKAAKKLMETGQYSQAIEILEQAIVDKPADKEAHFQIGVCHLNTGAFKKAHKHFDVAFNLKAGYGSKIGEQYIRAAELEFQRAASFSFKKGKLLLAGELFKKAAMYKPRLAKQGYDFFVKLGDSASMANGVVFYEAALDYTKDKKKKRDMGYKLLKVAAHKWPGPECEELKKKAAIIVGHEKADAVIPKPYMRAAFEKKYTDADADKNGYIYTFPWDQDIKKGDLLEVIGSIPGEKGFNAKEIRIWRGKKYKKKWYMSKEGYFRRVIESVPKSGRNVIWIEKDRGIEVTVKISNKTVPKPSLNLLDELMKE